MQRPTIIAAALALGVLAVAEPGPIAAQPAQGAPGAFERLREVMVNRVRDLKLTGDPDRDFAALLLAEEDNLVYLAKTHLEYGGDRVLRDLAQALSVEGQKRIDTLKEWQFRRSQADYKPQPDMPPPGSGPLDRKGGAAVVAAAPAQAPAAPPPKATEPAKPLPFVKGTIEDLDASSGKITIDHEAIPNLKMEGMTMVFRAADPAMVGGVKAGDRVRFTADRVNGQLTVTKIEKAR